MLCRWLPDLLAVMGKQEWKWVNFSQVPGTGRTLSIGRVCWEFGSGWGGGDYPPITLAYAVRVIILLKCYYKKDLLKKVSQNSGSKQKSVTNL